MYNQSTYRLPNYYLLLTQNSSFYNHKAFLVIIPYFYQKIISYTRLSPKVREGLYFCSIKFTQMYKMKITAFAATNNTESINLELIKSTLNHFPDAEVTILDLNDYEMPIFSPKRSLEGIPTQAIDFSKTIEQSDALIIGLAEYNGTFTTAFKNIFDWSSRIDMKVFKDKPTLLLATSPGPRGATTVLESAKTIFPFYGAQVMESFSLPSFYDNFKNGNIEDQDLKQVLNQTLEAFKNKLVTQEVE